ncbi:hypothetical protein BTVI_49201 [Pitangus sulphuratus]|nr:hypothetical protein BTVI_49201 [Pitangus sulphuratus]
MGLQSLLVIRIVDSIGFGEPFILAHTNEPVATWCCPSTLNFVTTRLWGGAGSGVVPETGKGIVEADGAAGRGTEPACGNFNLNRGCTRIFEPVCGTDDVLYSNECLLCLQNMGWRERTCPTKKNLGVPVDEWLDMSQQCALAAQKPSVSWLHQKKSEQWVEGGDPPPLLS